MPTFPSVEWFEEAGKILNASDSFKTFGTADTEMGIQVDDQYFSVTFEGFEVTGAREIDAATAADLDFTLVQPYDAWKDMLLNIKEHGRAEHLFTLNSLDLNTDGELAKGKDYNRRDAFYRFNQTLQDYFDFTAKMDTTFAK